MCAACDFLVSGTLRLFLLMFVECALGLIEKGRSKTSLLSLDRKQSVNKARGVLLSKTMVIRFGVVVQLS